MADFKGVWEKRTAECQQKDGTFSPDPDRPGFVIAYHCPNLKEVSRPTDMEGETYECELCGERYRLWYEDMK